MGYDKRVIKQVLRNMEKRGFVFDWNDTPFRFGIFATAGV